MEAFGQVLPDVIDAALGVLHGQVQVGAVLEVHDDDGSVCQGTAADEVHPFQRAEGILHGPRHAVGHLLWRGAGVHGADGDDGLAEVGHHLHAQPPVGHDATQKENTEDHDDERGPLDGDTGEVHGRWGWAWFNGR